MLLKNDKMNGGKSVLERIHLVIGLPAADAFHHRTCTVNFRTSINIPLKYATLGNPKQGNSGRPIDQILILSARLVVVLHI